MLSYERVPLSATAAPAGGAVATPAELVPLGEHWQRRDCVVLDRNPQQPAAKLRILAGHQHYWSARHEGQEVLEALVRRLETSAEARLLEHYAIGGLLPHDELAALDELASQRQQTRAEVARVLGANGHQQAV
ncbi:hypothetical protein ABZ671_17195 [Micromonospora sp. NPDC006766]|uniref:hypothetical protein n=1 Tax=Micromonospora sp. NPDC006766 TaxID=3154778 RepID=UPI0033C6FD25